MVHIFKMLNNALAVDVYSGAVHIVDNAAYALIEYFNKKGLNDITAYREEAIKELLSDFSENELSEAYNELLELYNNNLLFSKDIYKETAESMEKRSVVKAICLHVAHDCNLRCKYCFADTGSFEGERSIMPPEVGKRAIDFVIKNSGKRKNIEIDFFGGEPLMALNTVKAVVDYAREQEKIHNKSFRFTITTNGVLLSSEVMDYINENMVNVVLSIDGTKEVNDNMRRRLDNTGCYDTIVPKFIELANSRNQDNYYVRGTFTRENLSFAKDVLHLADLGFLQTSVEPVVGTADKPYTIREEDLPILFSEYERLAAEYIKRKKQGNGFNFFHFMIDLEQGPCVIKRLSGCGSGHEYVAVTPEGDIYPCHQFVGIDSFKMGTVLTEGFNEKIKKSFEKSNVYTKPDCMGCWAKFYCSGGCPANAYQINGDINIPYKIGCELQRKRVECALAIKAALA